MKNPKFTIGLILVIVGFLICAASPFPLLPSVAVFIIGIILVLVSHKRPLIKWLTVVVATVLLIPIHLLFLNYLPFEITNRQEIIEGKGIVKNIDSYYLTNKHLPSDTDYVTQKQFGISFENEGGQPAYQKLSDTVYKLTYMYGFDGPYLTYRSSTKQWSMEMAGPN